MTILKEYGIGADKKLRYNLMKGSGESLSNMIGQRIKGIVAYMVFEQENPETGELQKILKLMVKNEDGSTAILGTSSKSFVEGLLDYLVCMESDELTELEVGSKRSRNGRPYIVFIA